MPEPANGIVNLIGRILLCAIFLFSAFGKITNFEGTTGYMAAKGMPMTSFLLFGAIVFLLIGSASVIVGFKARIGALLLILFLIPTTLIFHNFWAVPEEQFQMEMGNFMKNCALIGGLIQVLTFGAGSLSFDAKLAKKNTDN